MTFVPRTEEDLVNVPSSTACRCPRSPAPGAGARGHGAGGGAQHGSCGLGASRETQEAWCKYCMCLEPASSARAVGGIS